MKARIDGDSRLKKLLKRENGAHAFFCVPTQANTAFTWKWIRFFFLCLPLTLLMLNGTHYYWHWFSKAKTRRRLIDLLWLKWAQCTQRGISISKHIQMSIQLVSLDLPMYKWNPRKNHPCFVNQIQTQWIPCFYRHSTHLRSNLNAKTYVGADGHANKFQVQSNKILAYMHVHTIHRLCMCVCLCKSEKRKAIEMLNQFKA